MSVHELAQLFGISYHTIHYYTREHIIPPPLGRGRGAHYDNRHVEALRSYQAIMHNNAPAKQVAAFCREQGISLATYIKNREQAIREFGIGIA